MGQGMEGGVDLSASLPAPSLLSTPSASSRHARGAGKLGLLKLEPQAEEEDLVGLLSC
jgi:hypothetical protein